jgi:hypothetical protein
LYIPYAGQEVQLFQYEILVFSKKNFFSSGGDSSPDSD